MCRIVYFAFVGHLLLPNQAIIGEERPCYPKRGLASLIGAFFGRYSGIVMFPQVGLLFCTVALIIIIGRGGL